MIASSLAKNHSALSQMRRRRLGPPQTSKPKDISSPSIIDSIDRSFSELTRKGAECWTEEAVRQSEEWKRIRALAADALDSFGWTLETPPSHVDEFVGGP